MYEPPLHRVEDLAELHALIRDRVFGLLISNGAEGLIANSVPFVLDATASRLGALKAHVARGNHQWRDLQERPDALVVFQGHDHYITPSWYETKRETGKVVPTWNYTMVQAKGRAKVMDDALARPADRGIDPGARIAPRTALGGRRRAGRLYRDATQGDRRHQNRDRRHPGQMEDEPEPQRGRPRRRRFRAGRLGRRGIAAMAEIVRETGRGRDG